MFKKLINRKQAGFTIIEVMIVLAIAGLILVVVLIAIPQLQRNQRDTARQNVASRLSTELGTYATNNGGAYPFEGSDLVDEFVERYVDEGNDGVNPILELKNPQTGEQYEILQASTTAAPDPASADDQLTVYPGLKCSGEVADAGGTISETSRQFAVVVNLERDGTYFCADNS